MKDVKTVQTQYLSDGCTHSVPYDDAFYEAQAQPSLRSARVVVPLIIELLGPRRVADVGCGVGTWLRAFIENGVEDVIGFDGTYVNKDRLLIPRERFVAGDITSIPILRDRADVALCLEVGEHITLSRSAALVDVLTTIAPSVVFSAAIPGQGGTHHINEQWPTFWRRLFENRGFHRIDPFRHRILHDARVEWWYRQNICVFVNDVAIRTHERVRDELDILKFGDFEILNSSLFSQLTPASARIKSLTGDLWQAFRRRVYVWSRK